jgi:hypothetical protein
MKALFASRAERIGTVSAACIMLGFVALAGFIYGSFFPGAFSSDAAVHLVLAQHVMKVGKLLSPEWFYPNSDLVVSGPFMLGMALIKLLGFGLPALWWTAGLTFAALWACMVLCLRAMGVSTPAAVVGACAALASTSNSHVEFIYIQAGYPFITLLYTLAFTLYVRHRVTHDGLPRPGWRVSIPVLLLIVLILALANPSRTLAFVIAPILMVELGPWTRPWRIRPRPLVLGLVATLFIGYLIYQSLLAQGLHFSLPSGFRSATVDLKRTKLQFFEALRFIFVVHPGFDHRILGGAISATVLLLGVCVLRPDMLSPRLCSFVKLCLWQMAAVLAGGLISGIFIDPYAVRYFLPALVLLMAVAAATSIDTLRQEGGHKPLAASFLAATGVAIVHATLTLGALRDQPRESGPVQTPHVLQPVTDALRQRGLTHGFVEWDANVMNVLGKGEVEFCQITYREQLLPFKWNVPLWCYDPARMPERFFLVLKPQNRQAARNAVQHTLVEPPVDTFDAGGYEVQVYRTADVDMRWLAYPVPDGADLKLPWVAPAANPQMFSRVIQPTAQKTFEFNGKPGEVVYGPYVNLSRGRYRLTWFGELPGADAHAIHFSVTGTGGRHLLGATDGRTVTPPDGQAAPIATIDFQVKVPVPGVNFVVEQRGQAHATLTHFRLERIDTPQP